MATNIEDKKIQAESRERNETSKVGSVCTSYRHMYQTNKKAERISIVALDAVHPVIPTRKVITRKKIDHHSLHRVVKIELS